MEKSNIKKEWDNETLLEYYAVLFFNLQEGKDVNDEWMDKRKYCNEWKKIFIRLQCLL